jgi:hypothetical protein
MRVSNGSLWVLCVFCIGLMRMCFVWCVGEAESFTSRDLAMISWANNMSCGVRCWCLYSLLPCFFRRRLRLALLTSLCVIVGGVVVDESVDVSRNSAKECGVVSLLLRFWQGESSIVIILQLGLSSTDLPINLFVLLLRVWVFKGAPIIKSPKRRRVLALARLCHSFRVVVSYLHCWEREGFCFLSVHDVGGVSFSSRCYLLVVVLFLRVLWCNGVQSGVFISTGRLCAMWRVTRYVSVRWLAIEKRMISLAWCGVYVARIGNFTVYQLGIPNTQIFHWNTWIFVWNTKVWHSSDGYVRISTRFSLNNHLIECPYRDRAE